LGTVNEICDDYNVLRALRPGCQRTGATWRNAIARVLLEEQTDGRIDVLVEHSAKDVGKRCKPFYRISGIDEAHEAVSEHLKKAKESIDC